MPRTSITELREAAIQPLMMVTTATVEPYTSAGRVKITISQKAFGPAMAWWVLIAAFVASGGQYMADIIEASYLMSGMAQH
mmetsp:Transcript_14287/g.11933  ORF Transcript_14287/g.11933 Transcript_14287/m.11933 type:complete len:81 (-) Transcript_14287:13-255(-)